MKGDLSKRLINQISTYGSAASVDKIVLFGSRARGDNMDRSDIDLAVYGGDFDSFYWNIKENIHSLLLFDVVRMDGNVSKDLENEIDRDGIILYEKN